MARNWFDQVAPPTVGERLWSIAFGLAAVAIAVTVLTNVISRTWPILIPIGVVILVVNIWLMRRRGY